MSNTNADNRVHIRAVQHISVSRNMLETLVYLLHQMQGNISNAQH